jgi:hypothetical protein
VPANAGSACNQDVDLVFVLDVSGSMVPALTKLDKEVGLVDEALKTKNLPSPAHYGLVVFVDDVKVLNGGAAYADLAALKVELNNQIQLTRANNSRQNDPNGRINLDWPENSLDALFAAAREFQWRPAASTLRTIIHITDASFWDLAVPSSGADTEQLPLGVTVGSANSYEATIDALRAQQIWANTFAAKTGGPPDGMMAPPSHGQFRGISVHVGIGFFEPYKGKPSIAMSTGGLAWDIDEVFDGKISLATPISMSVADHQCEPYPLQ